MNRNVYVPKGSMCRICKQAKQDCSNLGFNSMPRIKKPDSDGVIVVKCTEFDKAENAVPWADWTNQES